MTVRDSFPPKAVIDVPARRSGFAPSIWKLKSSRRAPESGHAGRRKPLRKLTASITAGMVLMAMPEWKPEEAILDAVQSNSGVNTAS